MRLLSSGHLFLVLSHISFPAFGRQQSILMRWFDRGITNILYLTNLLH